MAQLWGDWTLLVAVDDEAVPQAVGSLNEIGVACHKIGRLQAGPHSYLLREGELVRWSGVDAERFTESSWNRSKLADYLSGLVQASS